MIPSTLVTVDELHRLLMSDDSVRVVDCRFSLAEPELGPSEYLNAHLPGAVYAHLDEDLAGEVIPGVTGRHPLPAVETFATLLGTWGIDSRTMVVAYDDAGGAIAARLWWLLRWLGHDRVAVLDGGYSAWRAARLPVEEEEPEIEARTFVPRLRPELLASREDVERGSFSHLIDSRSAPRFRGDDEPIDPVAGHIPGAINRPFTLNLESKKFRDQNALRNQFSELLGLSDDPAAAQSAIFYCGSGVTAAHNLLALAHAGLGDAKLYNGSWSEWIADPERGVVRGD